jgi:hypothetical protein
MPSIIIATDLDPKLALKTVKNVAEDLEFHVSRTDDLELLLTKGNLFASIMVGAFIAYCHFSVFIEEKGERVRIIIQRNTPWWTGLLGVSRVKAQAKKLADRIEDDIEEQGGNLYARRET